MEEDELYSQIINSVLRLVSIRPRSIRELTDYINKKLKKSGPYNQDLFQKVLFRLMDLGYADDYKFALWWAEVRFRVKPKGEYVIRQELNQKGVTREIIDQVLENLNRLSEEESGQKSEVSAAMKASQKKLKIIKNLTYNKQKQVLYRYLMQRGFASETILSVIDEICQKE
jgi:regulatory protein